MTVEPPLKSTADFLADLEDAAGFVVRKAMRLRILTRYHEVGRAGPVRDEDRAELGEALTQFDAARAAYLFTLPPVRSEPPPPHTEGQSQTCDGCGRQTYSPENFGRACAMIQPDGQRCVGRFE